jgi:hypothetical protein
MQLLIVEVAHREPGRRPVSDHVVHHPESQRLPVVVVVDEI